MSKHYSKEFLKEHFTKRIEKEGMESMNQSFTISMYMEWYERVALLQEIVEEYNKEHGTEYVLEKGDFGNLIDSYIQMEKLKLELNLQEDESIPKPPTFNSDEGDE